MRTNPHNSMFTKTATKQTFCARTSYIGAAPAVSLELWSVGLMT
jgi:hypothetical protein